MLWSGLHIRMRTCSSSILCRSPYHNGIGYMLIGGHRSLTPSISRPHTPNSSSKTFGRSTRTPPLRPNSALSSPPTRRTYTQILSHKNNDWTVEDDDDDDQDIEQEYMYNENPDEDEFGLPSITSMRREARRIQTKKVNDPGGGHGKSSNGLSSLIAEPLSGQGIANSSDIAEERGPPNYPTTKKSEGKILRPQYKDILRGLSFHRFLTINAEVFCVRSCKLTPPHQPSSYASGCNPKGSRSPFNTNITHQQV